MSSTYTGPERRMQLDLRELVAKKRSHGWDLVCRQPLQMRRGRAVLDMHLPGVVTTRLEPTT